MVFQVRKFDLRVDIDRKKLIEVALKRKEEQVSNDLERENKGRVVCHFEDANVLVRRNLLNKSESIYEGPFKVVQVDYGKNSAQVDLLRKLEWFNFRRLKLFKGGQPDVIPDKESNVIENEMF
ncbi:hypothetical protein A0H76_486 [Hepatospora eriocheir]|uniref:Uncharacterized protein n=1 Tax=Hepatospora eriocheir TaxID=1081669 RepID=A0A1X0Q913_9MICR|nr:hypothetical protein A0H76_486 [Hepatospora eriocheir]